MHGVHIGAAPCAPCACPGRFRIGIGPADKPNGLSQVLIEQWDGASWSIVPSPSLGPFNNGLQGVAAVSANDVWAVGYYYNGGSSAWQTLVEHWDGTYWSIAPSPNPNSFSSRLFQVAALSADNVWAVGSYATSGPFQTLVERYQGVCLTPTPTATAPPPSNTPTATQTARPISTNTPSPTPTLMTTATPRAATVTNTATAVTTSTATATPCSASFSDVHPNDYFYEPVRYLYCHGAISGYADNTFRPYNLTTRGQLAKIVVLAEGWTIYTPPTPTFRDVPTTDPFYRYIETAYNRGIISGYSCGTGCLEYHPGNNVTRAQLCKIIVLAEGWTIYTPPAPTFRDVPTADPFYGYIETAYYHGIISGYGCGAGCLEFRPGNNATRGQIAKIVYRAVTGF